ncbi:MAG: UDP-N-acetylmuramoyl-L-alanyl-D-glutamate--2,6-diaminopimelate ligase [Methylophilaceae bacterium]|nr:MAG: UDP-N-acetylmuramoyl-L-alanyl-D-glutamate--2,6-diaminopimelate ligase [Methylophilaceae bacterium]
MTRYVIKSRPTAIVSDSRDVVAGALFLAYPGKRSDGRAYIADAIEKKASAVLWDPKHFDWNPDWAIENTPVANLKLQAGKIADQFYAKPSVKLWTVGVTGTNGKTSVTQWIAQCLNYFGTKAAVIGTLGNGLPKALEHTANTTPDALVLQKTLAEYVQQEVEAVAMEVSSHGIHQGRVNGVHFDVAVLTNLSRDHLDYHGSYEKYAAVKKRLFFIEGLKHVILNNDDDFGGEIKKELSTSDVGVLTYGINGGDIQASKVNVENGRIRFFVTTPYGQSDVSANLVGRFNVYNVLAVLATLLVSKVALTDAVEAIANIEPLSGRMQKFGGGKLPLVVVDYAHTPDSLKNVLLALKEEAKQRLICVFGCGGNRDQGKRAMMGAVASEFADGVVVTSDNPRDEDPDKIIQAILEGVNGEYAVEEDRAKAILIAISNAQAGDAVLIAGKGHEDYQEIAGEKHHFSDAEQVTKVLKRYEVTSA